MVICLQRDADLHMAQLMPLPLTVSCFSKIQTGFTFLVPAYLCVCVCVCVCVLPSPQHHGINGHIMVTVVFLRRIVERNTPIAS